MQTLINVLMVSTGIEVVDKSDLMRSLAYAKVRKFSKDELIAYIKSAMDAKDGMDNFHMNNIFDILRKQGVAVSNT